MRRSSDPSVRLKNCLIWSGFAFAVAVVATLVVVDWPALRKTASKSLPQAETTGLASSMSVDELTKQEDAAPPLTRLGPNELSLGSEALKHPALRRRSTPR
jgi:hypothetical protein